MTSAKRQHQLTRRVPESELGRACLVLVGGVIITVTLAFSLQQHILTDEQKRKYASFHAPKAGWFILVYYFVLCLSRYYCNGVYVLYDVLWACNMSLLLAALGMLTASPLLVGIAMANVSGDQICWYFDFVGWLLTGKFPLGVMKYLTDKENRCLSKQLTASHHLWFLPICLYSLKGYGMHEYSFLLSCAITAFLAIYSRMFTPFQVELPHGKGIAYMNTNGAFEFWKDIDIPFLHIFNHRHPLIYLPYLIVVGNLVVNGIPHLLLLGISITIENYSGS